MATQTTKERPKRIQLRRRPKGWRMPPNTVKVDRSTRWGNPFRVYQDGDTHYHGQAFGTFRAWWVEDIRCQEVADGPFRDQTSATESSIRLFRCEVHSWDVDSLRGKNLACWCGPDDACHADVLLEVANA